ncbi:hypothetical protein NT01EI_1973 [Edwardsiella ictaluri 93-146]|uniref:Uncharacterized protein n=1 Tax=Edwardsiella ictaluri (strain 93-146) TaxID=634503 RepID=C5BA28_EDWI9|nr:hypothetical protein NT01EI_1973 [Edwardsiella ictaluri 93-146]
MALEKISRVILLNQAQISRSDANIMQVAAARPTTQAPFRTEHLVP